MLFGTECTNGLAYGVVMHLLEDLREEWRVLYVDNFYTSPLLYEDLFERGTYASGTVRVNRKHFLLQSWMWQWWRGGA